MARTKGGPEVPEWAALERATPRAGRGARAADVFAHVQAGHVKAHITKRVALRDAADAHRALEGRHTTGAAVLSP